ncbi:Uncharacterised protein [Vibrio cincinnatiensis]|uniref:Uncharacterized protein n=1 Tax=Vibrio cincinnatiensis DSM 19608 TaxID=1123491 RepID=A0A1T4S4G7_VIBCI|nr:hypothetical protein [Vibrio cincinnatiensis]SKA22996.1 hypothetical protein SAMN02745782_02988 [Vibrio cincinnatiensis DSM 19608]SUP49401.1 Uncharacterised protein [Vibrio cincinnatiensis]
MANKAHKFWFKIRRKFYRKPVPERLYYFGFFLLLFTLVAMKVAQEMGHDPGIIKSSLWISVICIILGFLTDLYVLGKVLYKFLVFKWLFALVFSALVVTSNVLAKKDIYAITGFSLNELTEAQLLIAIVNVPLLTVTILTFIAMTMSLIFMVGQLIVGGLIRLNRYPLSRILLGTPQIGFLLKLTRNLGFDSDTRPMAAIISMVVFVAFLTFPPSYKHITLQSVKSEIIVWSSFYNGEDCVNLEADQRYLVHKDKTIILTYTDEGPSFDLGSCEKS